VNDALDAWQSARVAMQLSCGAGIKADRRQQKTTSVTSSWNADSWRCVSGRIPSAPRPEANLYYPTKDKTQLQALPISHTWRRRRAHGCCSARNAGYTFSPSTWLSSGESRALVRDRGNRPGGAPSAERRPGAPPRFRI